MDNSNVIQPIPFHTSLVPVDAGTLDFSTIADNLFASAAAICSTEFEM